MNWEAIGSVAELVAAITVVCTAFYLAMQIRQNTVVAKSQVMDTWASDFSEQFMANRDPVFSALTRRGLTDFSSLTPEEQYQFNTAYFVPQCLLSQNLLFHRKDGHVQEEVVESNLAYIAHMVATPGGKVCWENSISYFTSDFVEEIERLIPEESSLYDIPWMQRGDA